jgi:hypothetical protein
LAERAAPAHRSKSPRRARKFPCCRGRGLTRGAADVRRSQTPLRETANTIRAEDCPTQAGERDVPAAPGHIRPGAPSLEGECHHSDDTGRVARVDRKIGMTTRRNCRRPVRPVRATGRRCSHARASSKTASVVSGRGNLAFPGSVRVYSVKPLVCDFSTGALAAF